MSMHEDLENFVYLPFCGYFIVSAKGCRRMKSHLKIEYYGSIGFSILIFLLSVGVSIGLGVLCFINKENVIWSVIIGVMALYGTLILGGLFFCSYIKKAESLELDLKKDEPMSYEEFFERLTVNNEEFYFRYGELEINIVNDYDRFWVIETLGDNKTETRYSSTKELIENHKIDGKTFEENWENFK